MSHIYPHVHQGYMYEWLLKEILEHAELLAEMAAQYQHHPPGKTSPQGQVQRTGQGYLLGFYTDMYSDRAPELSYDHQA